MTLKLKKFIASVSTLLLALASILIVCFALINSDTNMNSKQGLPDLKGGVLDFSGYSIGEKYVKQHMKGEYEFFYKRWIVEDDYLGEPDTKVSVPHHYQDTVIDGKRLSNEGHSSYRVYVKGLPIGTKIWFINNNFVGGFYAYINKELVVKYGTREKAGNCLSNGGDDMTKEYVVKDDMPLEVVFEVSSSYQGGLTSPARLVINTLGRNPTSQYLTNNIGFVLLGVVLSLLIISFIVNINVSRKDFSFAILMGLFSIMVFFSIDVYWRILSIIKLNTYNPIIFITLLISISLSFALYFHLVKSRKIQGNRFYWMAFLAVSLMSITLYFVLMGTFMQVIPLMLSLLNFLVLIPPLTNGVFEGKKVNIAFLFIIFSLLTYFTITFFDLENIMIAGTEQAISYILLPLVITIIVLYRLFSVSRTKKYIQALEKQKEAERLKADALKEQIKPHFVFNCLTSIQSAYKEDTNKGEEMITMFSKHLRNNLQSSSYNLVPFETELSNILNYVKLENARKEKEIELLLDLEETNFSLPPLSLEPFVENAVKHSRIETKEDGYIELSTYLEERHIIILVTDNGVGFDANEIGPSSIGLSNAKERLALILGAKTEIESEIGKGTKIRISIPYCKQEESK